MTPFIFIVVSLLGSGVVYLFKNEKYIRISALVSAILFAVTTLATILPIFFNTPIVWSFGWWYLDRFAALLATLVVAIYVGAILASYRYIKEEYHEKVLSLAQVRLYFSLIHLFALFMIVALLANNIILLWIAIECTTLSTTFLVGLYKKDASIEAAWKYILLCSTGISLGLVGVLLMSYSARVAGIAHGSEIFMLDFLRTHAASLSPEIIRISFVFLFIGVGTKVGLVPMHSWLPDAHSKAPSPVSAMFSGILLNVALFAIIRFKFIADTALHSTHFTNTFFLIFGLFSLILPAFILLVQRNYKRMLAYSSIEHMGLLVFAFSLGPIGMMASIIHMIGHSLTKSMLFLGAGEILLRYKSTKVDNIDGAYKKIPYTSGLFLLGILSIIALPPSLLFVSEYSMFAAAFTLHPVWALLALVALSIIAFGMLRLTLTLLFSRIKDTETYTREKWNITHTVMTVEVVLLVALTVVFTTTPGIDFIQSIVRDIGFISLQ